MKTKFFELYGDVYNVECIRKISYNQCGDLVNESPDKIEITYNNGETDKIKPPYWVAAAKYKNKELKEEYNRIIKIITSED